MLYIQYIMAILQHSDVFFSMLNQHNYQAVQCAELFIILKQMFSFTYANSYDNTQNLFILLHHFTQVILINYLFTLILPPFMLSLFNVFVICDHRKRALEEKADETKAGVVEDALQSFNAAVKEGPDYVCTCCHRLMYRKTVIQFRPAKYTRLSDVLLHQLFPPSLLYTSAQQKIWKCKMH